MSKINGEKARAAIAKKNRTAMRAKTRAKLQEIRAAAAPAAAAPAPKKSTAK